eukprot:COSAG01_NODE_35102_length_537_cov_0.589041_1_plen_107_part_00
MTQMNTYHAVLATVYSCTLSKMFAKNRYRYVQCFRTFPYSCIGIGRRGGASDLCTQGLLSSRASQLGVLVRVQLTYEYYRLLLALQSSTSTVLTGEYGTRLRTLLR